MSIVNSIKEKNVFLNVKAGSKREFLSDLAQRAANVCKVDALSLFDTIMERENLGSTGFGGGTAIPHGRFVELNEPYVFFARAAYPVEFDAADGKPVDIAFLLISPENAGADHLTALAVLSRILKSESDCDKLRKMSTAAEIAALLSEL
ncbi:MAG: PTS sugar transporter subunit IIA [Alphaproteobacteria bacterium]|nr:PTS sugar transporter subunit IIA [Alphaproteobacteria bacterium]MBQ9235676.1 PTS sugar transporter subunit IIA [Alphaproteobacteria bacterium]